jgi:hypothetical protein
MSDENLRQLLARVHERLSRATSVDAGARKALEVVMHDIEKLLAREKVDVAPTQPRLESLAVRFEAEHPALAEVLRQLADTLGKAGI